jgi:hypothetical protein
MCKSILYHNYLTYVIQNYYRIIEAKNTLTYQTDPIYKIIINATV